MDSKLLFGTQVLQYMQSTDNEDDEIDCLLLAASESFERNTAASTSSPKPIHMRTSRVPLSHCDPGLVLAPHTSHTHSCRFAQPLMDEEIELAKTVADTKYCIGIFETQNEDNKH